MGSGPAEAVSQADQQFVSQVAAAAIQLGEGVLRTLWVFAGGGAEETGQFLELQRGFEICPLAFRSELRAVAVAAGPLCFESCPRGQL